MNSIPMKSLDMGKALSFLLMMKFTDEKADSIMKIISFIFFILFSAFTAFYCVSIKLNFSLIAVAIYLLTETELKIYGQ